MKKLQIFLAYFLLSFLTVSCSSMQVGFDEESPFYDGGVVYIYLDGDVNGEKTYRVYINNEDSEVSLVPGTKTRFGIAPQEIKIEILKGKQSASIDLNLKESQSYYLRVKDSHAGKLEIIEMPKSALEDTQDKNATSSGETTELKSVDEIQESESEFYYDPLE
ncbi:hypothetical protein [Sulfurimonas sp.]